MVFNIALSTVLHVIILFGWLGFNHIGRWWVHRVSHPPLKVHRKIKFLVTFLSFFRVKLPEKSNSIELSLNLFNLTGHALPGILGVKRGISPDRFAKSKTLQDVIREMLFSFLSTFVGLNILDIKHFQVIVV